jgi:hypothetical protein
MAPIPRILRQPNGPRYGIVDRNGRPLLFKLKRNEQQLSGLTGQALFERLAGAEDKGAWCKSMITTDFFRYRAITIGL